MEPGVLSDFCLDFHVIPVSGSSGHLRVAGIRVLGVCSHFRKPEERKTVKPSLTRSQGTLSYCLSRSPSSSVKLSMAAHMETRGKQKCSVVEWGEAWRPPLTPSTPVSLGDIGSPALALKTLREDHPRPHLTEDRAQARRAK